MSIQQRLTDDLKTAMRSGEKQRVETIRGLRAALQNAQLEMAKQRYEEAARAIEAQYAGDAPARDAALAAISADAHAPLDEAAAQAVISKEVKRRHDSIEMYRKGNRADLAAIEEAEITILQGYLPQMLGADELRPQVRALIDELGLQGPAAIGKLMPVLMERFKGRAEGRILSQLARELLAEA